MSPEDNLFLKTFFQNVIDSPLSPQDERYIPLYEDPLLVGFDPVEMLARAIAWAPGESVQLLSGFAKSHQTALVSSTELPVLARFLDTHLALCYRNGEEWYDIHPLIADHVDRQVKDAQARSRN